MTRLSGILFVLTSLTVAGCGFDTGSGVLMDGLGSTFGGSTASPGPSRAAAYTWDTPVAVDTTAGNGITAMLPSTNSAGDPTAIVAHGTSISEVDAGVVAAMASLPSRVTGLTTVAGRTFASTGDPATPGAGDVYEETGTGWVISQDHAESEGVVAGLGTTAYSIFGDRTGGPGKVDALAGAASVWVSLGDLPLDCVPSAAIAHAGEVWVGGGPAGATGRAVLLHGSAAGWTETLLPGGATTDRQEVTALLSTPSGLAIAVGTFDAVGLPVSGQIFLMGGGTPASVGTWTGDAPLSIGWQDGTLYAGTSGGSLEYLDGTTWTSEPGLPVNQGIVSLLALDADTLLVGARATGGAQLHVRRVDRTTVPTLRYADVKPHLLSCAVAGCHASSTAFRVSAGLTDDAGDYAAVLNFVDTGNPAGSRLLTKATGTSHPLTVFSTSSTQYTELLAWIQAGAPN